jgi:hypothetical protein
MDWTQFLKHQRQQKIQRVAEESSEKYNNDRVLNAEIDHGIGSLQDVQNQILQELIADNPELVEQLVDLNQEVKESSEKAFVKEMTRNDRRFKEEEFDFSDLYGEEGSIIPKPF